MMSGGVYSSSDLSSLSQLSPSGKRSAILCSHKARESKLLKQTFLYGLVWETPSLPYMPPSFSYWQGKGEKQKTRDEGILIIDILEIKF